MIPKKYYVLLCPRCGQWSVGEVTLVKKYTFKCRYCRKTRKLHKKTEAGLTLKHSGPYGNPRKASIVARELNGKKHEKGLEEYQE